MRLNFITGELLLFLKEACEGIRSVCFFFSRILCGFVHSFILSWLPLSWNITRTLVEHRAGFEPATLRLCRPFPWSTRAPVRMSRLLRGRVYRIGVNRAPLSYFLISSNRFIPRKSELVPKNERAVTFGL